MSPRSSPAGSLSLTLSIKDAKSSGLFLGGGAPPASASVSLTCPQVAQKSPPTESAPSDQTHFLSRSADAPSLSRCSGSRVACLAGPSPPRAYTRVSPPQQVRAMPPHPILLLLAYGPLTCAAGSSAARSPWCCRQPPRPPQCSILPKPALQTLPHFRFPPLPEAAGGGV